jgi:polyferredoxin
VTLAKLTAILTGYFPSIYTNLALYTMLIGFLVTSMVWRRNIYCLYMCPFGAAQRCINVIGGFNLKLPVRAVRFLDTARNALVFAAIFAGLITLQPALATYEPFAALFALTGSTLQWMLLFLVLVTSLLVKTPWCRFLCPMRSFEIVFRNAGEAARGGRARAAAAGGSSGGHGDPDLDQAGEGAVP